MVDLQHTLRIDCNFVYENNTLLPRHAETTTREGNHRDRTRSVGEGHQACSSHGKLSHERPLPQRPPREQRSCVRDYRSQYFQSRYRQAEGQPVGKHRDQAAECSWAGRGRRTRRYLIMNVSLKKRGYQKDLPMCEAQSAGFGTSAGDQQ